MSAHIFDIDGTIVKYHTNIWLKGAKERIIKLANEGHQIIFITMRDEIRDASKEWSPQRTRETILKDLVENGVPYKILYNVGSPRKLYDDNKIEMEQRKTNQAWI